jgi:hypothetical protein
VSRELSEVAAFARIGAMESETAWVDVLRGRTTEEAIDACMRLPRLVFLDEERTSFSQLSKAIGELKQDFPGQPIMLLVDYVQLMDASVRNGMDARTRVADAVGMLRVLIQKTKVLGLVLSQMSRKNAEESRKGSKVGADTADGGAESAAIEQAAAITAQIGRQSALHADGSRDVALSIGKARYGGGDRVIELKQWGATGITKIIRDVAASSFRQEEQETRDAEAREKLRSRILEGMERLGGPSSRSELVLEVGGNRQLVGAAIAALIASGELVEVAERRKQSRSWLIWSRKRATETGTALRGGAAQ